MSDINSDAAAAREAARQDNGKFGAQEHSESGDVDLTAAQPSPADMNFEAEGLEALIEDYRERLEWPEREHYEKDDLAAIEEKVGQMEARLAYLRATPATPTFDDACQQYFEARDAASAAAETQARSIIKEHYPTAKYLTLECSDQGANSGMWPRAVYDATGDPIADIDYEADFYDDLEAATSWLDQDGEYWMDVRHDQAVPKGVNARFWDGVLEIS